MVCLSIIGCSSNVYSGHDADAWPGFLVSLQLFVLTLLGSIPLGIPVAFMRMSKIAPLRWIARIYISVMRGTPLMLQMFAIYFAPYYVFGIFAHARFKWTACVVAFIINYAPVTLPRSIARACSPFPRGQYEAAEVLGYSRVQTFLYIVMPQVAKRILPAMGNEIITLVRTRRWRLPLAWVRCSRRPRRWSPRR